MKVGRVQRVVYLLGTIVISVAAVASVQGVGAAGPSVASATASTSVQSKAYPNPGTPTKPSPMGTQSKSGSSPKVLTAGGTWSWQNPLPDGNPLFAISCPSTSACFAASSDGKIRATTNGGTTWTVQATGISTALNAISCFDAMTCVAVGDFGAAIRTSNGGTNWSAVTINGGSFLAGVGCPSALICFAVGATGSVLKTADGGATWAAQSSGTASHLFAVSCASTTNCVAAGAAGMTTMTTDGSSWSALNAGTASAFYGVSCATTAICDAVGDAANVRITQSGGAGWFGGVVNSTVTLTAISCPSSSTCYVAGIDGSVYNLNSTNNGTLDLRGSTGENGGLYAISCPTAQSCFAAGDYGTVVATSNGGTGWKQQSPPTPAPNFRGISCASTTVCFAVGDGGAINATSDGGSTWPSQTSGITTSLSAISCPSASVCFAVGAGGAVRVTTNGGTTWSAETSGVAVQLSGISCPTTLVCVADGAAGTVIRTANGGTSWSAPQASGTTNDLYAVSCVSASVCTASGDAIILGTVNSGGTWTTQYSLGAGYHQYLQGVSCADASNCVAIGAPSVSLRTSNGGTTWTFSAVGTQNTWFYGVSCPSSLICFAAGSSGPPLYRTGDGGANWSLQPVPANADFTGISCPSTTTCFAVASGSPGGAIYGTSDGGSTSWRGQVGSGTTAWFQGVSCASTTTCLAITSSSQVFRTTNSGLAWFPALTLQYSSFNAITCPSVSVCFAVGGTNRGFGESTIYGTTDGGVTWTAQVPSPTGIGGDPGFISISCATTTACFAVAAAGTFTKTTDGTNWSAPTALGAATTVSAISCASPSVCFATDAGTPGQVFATTNGGTSWGLSFNLANDPQAGQTGPFDAISCPAVTTCYAAGAAGLVATTTDGGANWRTDGVPSSARLSGVSCPAAGTCYASAVDSAILYTTDYGGTWTIQTAKVYAFYAGISCPTTTACFAVGAYGVITATTTAGAAWTVQQPAGPTTRVGGMSCTSSSDCYAAANNNILVTHNGGTTWTTQLAFGDDQIESVSCPAANTCFAVGWPGTIYFTGNGGTTWARQPNGLFGSDNTFIAVSCATTTACVAVGTHGTIISTSNGTTWAAETSGTTQVLTGVSCPTSISCIAVGLGGLTMTRSGGSWQAYASGTTQNLHGVSCAAASSCYAVGSAGTLLMTSNRGANWAVQTSGTTIDLYAVNCPQTTMCLAAGNFGAAIITFDGSIWSALNIPTGNALRAAVLQDVNHAWLAGFGGTILANPTITLACASLSVSANPTSPQLAGTPVLLTAQATGCPSPRYRFWIRPPGGSWAIVQDYSATATYNWSTFGPIGTYSIEVDARDGSETSAYDVVNNSTFMTTAAPKCAAPTLTANPTSPRAPGTQVIWTATSTTCTNPRYQFWEAPPGGAWSIVQAYSPTATFTWNSPTVAGSYRFEVDIRDGSESSGYDVVANSTFVLQSGTPCTTPGLTASPPSPGATGAGATFTATTTACPNARYQFWVQPPGGAWSIAQAYGPTNTFAWGGGGAAGVYHFEVDVRDASETVSYDAVTNITYQLNPCSAVTLGAAPPSSQPPGTSVLLTGTPTCLGTPSYRFWVRPPGGTWTIKQDYSPTSTYTWNTTGLPTGSYGLEVDVRNQGASAGYEAARNITYVLGVTACTTPTLGANPVTPGPTGGSVTFTATTTGCPTPNYRFWVQPPGGAWIIAQNYGASATFVWTGTGSAGIYHVEVDVRDASESVAYDAVTGITYQLSGCSAAGLTANPPTGGAHGTVIVLTATSTCPGTATYKFWIKAPGGTWTVVQPYGTGSTFSWTPATAGAYSIEVDVRDQGATDSYEKTANITYSVT